MPQPLRKSPYGDNLTVDTSGRILMPSQPAFGATNSNNTQQSGDIVLDTADTNIGGHYSTATGRFTAPINGNYHFTFITIAGTDTNFRINFRKNGGNLTPYGYIASDGNDTAGVATVISLVAGDYVSVFTVGTIEPQYTSFCGFLIG